MLFQILLEILPRFCINHFSNLQKSKHEKRLETEDSSLRNPVIMRGIKSRLTFGDRCSTNWAIPLNIKLLHSDINSLQEIYYHRHAVLSSFFQHKNADLSKNLYCRVWYARHARFTFSKIACDVPDSRTSLSWSVTNARPRFCIRKPHVYFRRLRCGWVLRSKNVNPGACERGVRFIVHPSVYNWVWEFLNWQSEPHIFWV